VLGVAVFVRLLLPWPSLSLVQQTIMNSRNGFVEVNAELMHSNDLHPINVETAAQEPVSEVDD